MCTANAPHRRRARGAGGLKKKRAARSSRPVPRPPHRPRSSGGQWMSTASAASRSSAACGRRSASGPAPASSTATDGARWSASSTSPQARLRLASGRTVWHLASGARFGSLREREPPLLRPSGPRRAAPAQRPGAGPGRLAYQRACACPSTPICSSCPLCAGAAAGRASLALAQRGARQRRVNAHIVDLDALEDAPRAHCTLLQQRRAVARSTTRFHWWPQRIQKRQGSWRN